ncbi:MAG: hypothetical protein Q8L27_02440 [archaeon]|nr:hypothetical protein [archaeon]
MLEEKTFKETQSSIEKARSALSSGLTDITPEERDTLQGHFRYLTDYLNELNRKLYHPDYKEIEEAKEISKLS